MGDIAKSSGLTRPTLYQSFADKDAVFAAVMSLMAADMFRKLINGLVNLTELEARLYFVCEAWGVGGLDIVLENPNAEDLFDLSHAPVQKLYADFEIFVAGILRDSLGGCDLGVSAEELAKNISFSIKGFKAIAKDASSLRRMIKTQTAIIVAAIGS